MKQHLSLFIFLLLSAHHCRLSAADNDAALLTQTIYGFLDFTTTIGNTVMVFSPQSAPPPGTQPEPTTEAPVITTKPLATVAPKIAETTINPTKLKPSTIKVEFEKPTTAKPKEVEPLTVEAVTPGKPPVEQKPKVTPKPKQETKILLTASPVTPSPPVTITSAPPQPSLIIDNVVHDPEYDLLSRQPPQYVEENFRVVSLKPSHKNSRPAVVVTPEKAATSSVLATRAPAGAGSSSSSSSRHHKNKKNKIRPSSTLQVLKTAAPAIQPKSPGSSTPKAPSHRSSTRKSSKKGSSHRSSSSSTTQKPEEDVVIVKSTTTTTRNKPKRKHKNKNSTTSKPRYQTTSTTTTEAAIKRAFKPKLQSSNSDLDGNNNLHITKLNRAPGRWQYKTSPKPRVSIRKPNVEVNGPLGLANVSSPSINVYPEPTTLSDNGGNINFLNQNVIYNQSDLDFEGSQNGAVLNNIDQEGKQKFFTETINVEISTPANFGNTYYEIATIKKPFIFQAGVLKKTRYITVTSTLEKYLSTETAAEARNENEPLTEDILATTEESMHGMLTGSVSTLPALYLGSDSNTPYLETVTETFSTVNQKFKTQVLPVINEKENETVYHTLVQTIDYTTLITVSKTVAPELETKHFDGFKDFVGSLDEAGSEINLDLEFGDEGNHESPNHEKNASEADSTSGARNKTTAALLQPTTVTPELPHLTAIPSIITNSRPVVKLETLWESYVVPITNGLSTSYRTLSKAKGVVEKTEYVVDTTTLPPQIIPPTSLNPFLLPLQQQFQTITTPVVQQAIVTETQSKVLKLMFGARTAYTTLYSTQVVPTLQTTYVTTTVPVQPTAQPFPGYFPQPYNPFAYLG